MLVTENLDLFHGPVPIVRGLDLSLRPGQVTAVFGPNGSGKSTLIRALFGDHIAERGSLSLDGVAFRPSIRRSWKSQFGYMPQDRSSCCGLTALEVVLLGSVEHLSLRVTERALRDAASGLDQLGILHLAQRRVETLSGGQRQLVFFAQALLRKPRVLLLDEPVGALDLRHQILLLNRVREITAARNLISVVVLHDLNLVATFADRVIVIHEGCAKADGAPQDVFSSQLLQTIYGVEACVHRDVAGRSWIQILSAREENDVAA
jgi:iron complex transport system ATP-binding protein